MIKNACLLLLLLNTILLTACGSGGGGGSVGSISQPPPSNAVTASVTMGKVTLASAESTSVTATIVAGGKPVEGVTVSFVTTMGMGSLNFSSAITNANGMASVQLTAATTTGVAETTVSATVNGIPVSKTMPYFVNLPSLQLSTPAPRTVDAGTITTITAKILDANGAPYTAQDVYVYLDSVYGGLSSYRVRSSGGVVTVLYFAPSSSSIPITDTITINLGSSTVKTFITVNPPVIPPTPDSTTLSLAVAPTAPKPGDVITATITYTNTNTSASLGGVTVNINSNRVDILPNTTAVTDAAGNAVVNMTVSSGAPAGTVVTLYASSGTTQSTSTIVTIGTPVADAAKLTLTMGATATWVRPFTGVVIQGNKATFVTSQGLPIVGQPITISVDRVDGFVSPFTVTLNGTKFTDSATPANTVIMNTDTTGTVLIPTLIEGTVPSNYVIYWRAVTSHNGVQYVAYGSTLVTVPSITPPGASASIIATRINATTVDVTFTAPASDGGSAITGYTVSSSPAGGVDTDFGTTVLTHRITGLTTGTPYTFTVVATNAVGSGSPSAASNSVTP